LFLAARALGRDNLTEWGKRRAAIALAVSPVGCAFLAFWIMRLASLR
jgi:hypothetical protein